jgi:hypothetical protein
MTRCFALAALAAILLVAPARAQVSFTFDDLYGVTTSGETVTTQTFGTDTNDDVPADDRAEIDALIALQGANQTWDFTTIAYPNELAVSQTFYSGGDVAGLPGASNFPDANYAALNDTTAVEGEDTAGYVYADVTGDQFVTQGIYVPAQDGNPEIVLTYEPDGLQQLTFPLTYGAVTEDQTTQTFQGFTVTTDYRSEVVGYGTLITPVGSFQTLMIEYEITVSVAGFGTTTTIYSWATAEGVSASANNFEVPQGGRAYYASYSTRGGGGSNSAPQVSGPVEAEAVAGETAFIDVLANVTDADGDNLTITDVSDPEHGTAEVADVSEGRRQAEVVAYTSNDGYVGEDSFTFTVSDGTDEATGTVTVTVVDGTSVEDGPGSLVLAVAPNPSAGAARVVLSTPRADHATVTVWDAVGREVVRLHDGPLAAGAHTFALAGGALAPGVYLARVTLGEAVTTARLTITR